MGRYTKNRSVSEPKPPQKIELSDKNKRLRITAVCVFVVIAAAAFAFGALNMTAPNADWSVITSDIIGSGEFAFNYNFGNGGMSARAAQREITALYNESLSQCRMLFSADEGYDNVINIRTINANPNSELRIEPTLYQALEQIVRDDSRILYLQPIYSIYSGIFGCSADSMLADFDPLLNPEIKQEFAQTAKFALDCGSVELQLLGDNKVRLFVSEEYLEYAAEAGITDFIGFTRLRNAFTVDYIAEKMKERGFTNGIIASYDGFTVNLDDSESGYTLNIFDRRGSTVYHAAEMNYSGSMAIVSLRDYPFNSLDDLRFYETESGEIRTPYIGFDGISKSSVSSLTCFSREKTCAEIALRAEEIFIADALDELKLKRMENDGIHYVFCEDLEVICSDSEINLGGFYTDDEVSYSCGE